MDALAVWCERWLGSPPAAELFEAGYLSTVKGLRLADGREVVVKVRPYDGTAGRMRSRAPGTVGGWLSVPRVAGGDAAARRLCRHCRNAGLGRRRGASGQRVAWGCRAASGQRVASGCRVACGAGSPADAGSPRDSGPASGRRVGDTVRGRAGPACRAGPGPSVGAEPGSIAVVDRLGSRRAGLWPTPEDRDADLNAYREPQWLNRVAAAVRDRLRRHRGDPVIGHGDWHPENWCGTARA